MGMTVTFTDEAVKEIAKQGYDENYGARPLRRAIRSKIEDALSEQILEGKINKEKPVTCDYKENSFVFE